MVEGHMSENCRAGREDPPSSNSPIENPNLILSLPFDTMNLDDKVGMDLVPQSEHLCYVRCNFCNTVLAVGIPCKRLLETVTVKCGHCSNLSFLSTRPPLQGQCLDPQTSLTLQISNGLKLVHVKEMQSFSGDFRKGTQFSSSSSSTSSEPSSPKAPFVVKRKPLTVNYSLQLLFLHYARDNGKTGNFFFFFAAPEKKHRLPSAYNRFMKEEIQRIKAANPEIPHREAFSAAAKNVRYTISSSLFEFDDKLDSDSRDLKWKQWARYIPNSPAAAASACGSNNNEQSENA
ncbi:hypothetical protein GQ457_04G010760 [Hibiscus cannabinus]